MLTTLLNPTVWLLTALAVLSGVGAWRRWGARQAFDTFLGMATRLPVLLVLGVLAIGGAASRLVLGYVAPGTYAEEVLAARAILSERQVYGSDDREEFGRWMADEPAATDPWTLPGVSTCQARAAADRPRFYTAQAHSPVLLVASVPVVAAVGGRGLYVVLSLASLLAITALVVAIGLRARIPPRSRVWALLAVSVVGWQPVLAGLRQGDAVLLAAALLVLSWISATQARTVAAGVAAGLAAAANVPLLLAVPAYLRHAPRVALTTALTCTALAVATLAAGGAAIARGFADGAGAAAALYSAAPLNYAVSGRVLTSGAVPPVLVLASAVTAALAAAWLAGTMDRALGAVTVVAVLASPVAWSQHLALALVALAVVLAGVLNGGSATALGAWALLALPLSLPDGGAVALRQAFDAISGSIGPAPLPIPTIALLLLGVWLAIPGTSAREPRTAGGGRLAESAS